MPTMGPDGFISDVGNPRRLPISFELDESLSAGGPGILGLVIINFMPASYAEFVPDMNILYVFISLAGSNVCWVREGDREPFIEMWHSSVAL